MCLSCAVDDVIEALGRAREAAADALEIDAVDLGQEDGLISGLDWFPTLVAAAGNPNIGEELKKGKQLGDRNYKVYLDGYNQMDMITGKGPSNRHEIFYFGESELGAVRIDDFKYRFIDQPDGWLGEKSKPDVPYLINLRLDAVKAKIAAARAAVANSIPFAPERQVSLGPFLTYRVPSHDSHICSPCGIGRYHRQRCLAEHCRRASTKFSCRRSGAG